MATQNNDLTALYNLSTGKLAGLLDVTAQGIRKRYSQTGTYWGVRPIKLPNGRLMWPADTLERIMGGR